MKHLSESLVPRCWEPALAPDISPQDLARTSQISPHLAHIVIAEKTGLCLQMEGPCSSYAARVWHTLLNSGVDASIEPPNHTAKRCVWSGLGLGAGPGLGVGLGLGSGIGLGIGPGLGLGLTCMWCEMTLTSTGMDLSLPPLSRSLSWMRWSTTRLMSRCRRQGGG